MGDYGRIRSLSSSRPGSPTRPPAAKRPSVGTENSPDDAEKEATVNINRVIKLSATAGTRGTDDHRNLQGLRQRIGDGVNLNGEKLDEVTITDNTGTLEIDTTSSKFEANEDEHNHCSGRCGQ